MNSAHKPITAQGKKPAPTNPRIMYSLWSLSLSGLLAFFALQSFYPNLIGPASNVLPSVCVGVMLWSALKCVSRYGPSLKKRFQAAWAMFSLGAGLWLVAELTWAFYYFYLNDSVPYPSVADVFYVAGYVPMLLGLAFYLKVFAPGMTAKRLAVATSMIVAATAAVIAFVVPPEFAMSEPLVQRATDIAYPVLDLALLAIALLAIAIFFGGSLSRWLVIFGGAATAYIVADELFLYQVASGTYVNGGVDDFIFLIGYMLFGLAFYEHRRRL